MPQFLLFCIGGVIGFAVDAGVLRLMVSGAGMDAYLARLFVSFPCAATATWLWNRHNTFRGTRHYGLFGEWARYLLAASFGFLVGNYSVYVVLYALVPLVQRYPELGVAAGSATGLVVNYTTSRWWIYRHRKAPPG
jgi:putative flippase GtrA